MPTAHPRFPASAETTHRGANKEFRRGGLHHGLHLRERRCLLRVEELIVETPFIVKGEK